MKVSGKNNLRALSLIRIRGPGIKEVTQLGTEHPAKELDLKFQKLNILALLNVLRVTKRIGVSRIQTKLIQIANVRVDTDVHVTVLGVGYAETEIGRVATIELVVVILLRSCCVNGRR